MRTRTCPACGRLLDSPLGRAPHLLAHARRGELVATLVYAPGHMEAGQPVPEAERPFLKLLGLARWAFRLPGREVLP